MLTKGFWLGESGALVRAVRTAAQTAIATIGVGTTNLFTADLKNVAALSLSAAVLSLLMSLDRSSESKIVAPRVNTEAIVTTVYEPTYGHGAGEDLR
jgi:hypothetical protein